MSPAERKQCRCGKKARLNREFCLDCELEGIKAGARRDAPLGKMPTAGELMDLARRERDGTPPKAAPPATQAEDKPLSPEGRGGVYCDCGEPLTPLARGNACEKCRRRETHRRWTSKKKENDMDKVKAKCSECRSEPSEGERLYGGRCKECREKGKGNPSTRRPEGKGEGERKAPQKSMGGKREAGPLKPISEQLLGELRRRARALVALARALEALGESDPCVKVPTLKEIIEEIEG